MFAHISLKEMGHFQERALYAESVCLPFQGKTTLAEKNLFPW